MDKNKALTIKNYDIYSTKKIPNRYNMKYRRIEKYEDYEFTHCIAYEMAIRNKEVIKLTNIIENLNILYSYIQDLLPNKYKYEMSQEVLALRSFNSGEDVSSILNKIHNLKSKMDNFLVENLTLEQVDYIVKSFDKIIKKDNDDYLLNIINKYNSDIFEKYASYTKKSNLFTIFHNAITINKINIILILSDSIEQKLEKEYYTLNEKKSITSKNIKKNIPKDTNYEPNVALNNHFDSSLKVPYYKDADIYGKGYISFQGGFENDDSFSINEIIPNFSQPLRMFNTMKVSINPSLPLNDILSFVKQIKEDYDKKNSLKSFFELIMKDLDISNETKKSTIDNPSSFSKEKWADIFYIYDYFQFYLSDEDKINKSKTINGKESKENVETIIAKEISLQLSFYHLLNYKNALDFTKSFEDYNSAYSWYDADFLDKIQGLVKNNANSNLINYLKLPKDKEKEIEEKIISEIKSEKRKSISKKEQDDRIKEEIRKEKRKRLDDKESPLFYMTALYYVTADHIKTDYYPRMKKLIDGEYKKLIDGRDHEKNSFIDGKNNVSSKL